ncbi:3-hydroxyacyl-CoA dehydrogenase NAD-binding domain-containing protein [Sporosarcina aquimarina]|uniref:3-hydroxyacyl-CoA dehydrogenase family protein n=1 Tax=Sporosarcina aquimarina TaxID=114975 RepID=UPI002041344C|nr:3-hydroxyacyl-CoA dehydrogenase NAD-binding domain-containing protein [Sporosarcina aquimarina]MCM3757995.1 3-hydroxyacyl-CoA dehydrogenase NAD-binding domain-containing protein [Sporosarcina aquimarina]
MEKISIIGCGTMGHSIGLAAAWAGFPVKLIGMNEADLETAKTGLQNKLTVMMENELIDLNEIKSIRGNIELSTSLEESVSSSDFIFEVIPEQIELKWVLYKKLEALVSDTCLIASNTSGFKPSELAKEMKHPNRFIVTHFWNPAHLIPLVEVVTGEHTDERTIEQVMKILEKMNKKPVLLKKEIPGFIGNRLQYALFREAQYLLDIGAATKEDIDAAVTYSIGRRLPITGPLMTADMGGLDVFSAISNYLFSELSTAQQSGETLTRLVDEKHLGDKNGQGFYEWDEKTSKEVNEERERTLIHFLKYDRNNREEENE